MSIDISPAAQRRAVPTLAALAVLAVLAMPAQAASDKPLGPSAAASSGTSAGAQPKSPSKAGGGVATGGHGSAPGTDCSAGAGTKVPTWPKCPGGQKPKAAGGS